MCVCYSTTFLGNKTIYARTTRHDGRTGYIAVDGETWQYAIDDGPTFVLAFVQEGTRWRIVEQSTGLIIRPLGQWANKRSKANMRCAVDCSIESIADFVCGEMAKQARAEMAVWCPAQCV